MTLDHLKAAKRRAIGSKQTAKALGRDEVRTVFIASDAEERVTREISSLAEQKGIEVVMVETMAALGQACGIEVGAATAAIMKD